MHFDEIYKNYEEITDKYTYQNQDWFIVTIPSIKDIIPQKINNIIKNSEGKSFY